MNSEINGRIRKATGGFYYVDTAQGVYQCRPRGIFRKDGVTPYVGDVATIQSTEDGNGILNTIAPRKNQLIRPPVANIDQLILVVSTVDPLPNLLILDKLIAIACYKDITPVLVITKTDMASADRLEQLYTAVGVPVFSVSNVTGTGVAQVKSALADRVSAFSGNSGVGKSSLLNRIDSRFDIQTGVTSVKLGRGRHTTRHVELYKLDNGGYAADTPGFSAVDADRFEAISKENLQFCFPEFHELLHHCRYTGCSHTVEQGCAILEALTQGLISPSRHKSYTAMYQAGKEPRH